MADPMEEKRKVDERSQLLSLNASNLSNGTRYTAASAPDKLPDVEAYGNLPSQSWRGFTKAQAKQTKLIVVTLLMLGFQFANRIMYKLVTYPMFNYPLFLNFFCCFLYIPIAFAYIVPVSIYYPDIITKEMLAFPVTKFAFIGLLDAISNTLQNISVNYVVNAALIILIQQSAIPFSMIISAYMLGHEYNLTQYTGAFLVISGILVSLYPTLVGDVPSNVPATPQEEGRCLLPPTQ